MADRYLIAAEKIARARRVRAMAAIVAMALSVAVHIYIFRSLSESSFSFIYRVDALRHRFASETMRIDRVARLPSLDAPPGRGAPEHATQPTWERGEGLDRLRHPVDMAALTPATLVAERLAAGDAPALEPHIEPFKPEWQPRQEILVLEKSVLDRNRPGLERRWISPIERVPDAAPHVLPVDRKRDVMLALARAAGDGGIVRAPVPEVAIPDIPVGVPKREAPEPAIGKELALSGARLFEAPASTVSTFRPIERHLTANVTTYDDSAYRYFRIRIDRAGDDVLPVIPKDVLLVQDVSGSISERRLHFCREALIAAIATLRPEDRFNVVKFRHELRFCFESWVSPTPQALAMANSFISNMRSYGSTDILTAIRQILNFPIQPGRPVVVILITDGISTVGITDSAAIVREFSELNRGSISLYTLGIHDEVNRYMLDLLSYLNRGDARLVTEGRWAIPRDIARLMQDISDPVLTNVRFTFSALSEAEVLPFQTPNLYRDRPIDLFGRRRIDVKGPLLFHATGLADNVECDMVFSIDLSDSHARGSSDIVDSWARQKVYHLVAEYARTADATLLETIRETAERYRVPIPHEKNMHPPGDEAESSR